MHQLHNWTKTRLSRSRVCHSGYFPNKYISWIKFEVWWDSFCTSNPCRDETIFRKNRNIFAFSNNEMLHVPVGPVYSTKSIPWLLINWRRKGPEHQHPSNWPSYPEIFLFFTHNWMMLSGNRELIIALYILFRDSPRVDAWFVHGSRGYGLIYDDKCDCQFMSLSTGGDILRLRCYQMYLVLETVLRCSNTNRNYIISWTLSEQNIVLFVFTI